MQGGCTSRACWNIGNASVITTEVIYDLLTSCKEPLGASPAISPGDDHHVHNLEFTRRCSLFLTSHPTVVYNLSYIGIVIYGP